MHRLSWCRLTLSYFLILLSGCATYEKMPLETALTKWGDPYSYVRDSNRRKNIQAARHTHHHWRPAFEAETLAPDTLWVAVYDFFDGRFEEQWLRIEDYVRDNRIRYLILDLTDNIGGYVEKAVYLADRFVGRDNILLCVSKPVAHPEYLKEAIRAASEEAYGELLQTCQTYSYMSQGGSRCQVKQIFIVTSSQTMSAPEIFLLIMKDQKLATQVGEQTAGKSG